MEIFTAAGLSALLQVIAIDLVLAGDNAIVIGLAAAGLPKDQRKKAILVGIAAATVLRIIFALITQWLLAIGPMLLIAGGLLLLWVCWKMWRELSVTHEEEHEATEALDDIDNGKASSGPARKTFAQAAWQIVIADVSMSLDNVLAVAGAAMEHPTVLIIGLALSIALMGFAASFVARLLHRYRWIAYIAPDALIVANGSRPLVPPIEWRLSQPRPGRSADAVCLAFELCYCAAELSAASGAPTENQRFPGRPFKGFGPCPLERHDDRSAPYQLCQPRMPEGTCRFRAHPDPVARGRLRDSTQA